MDEKKILDVTCGSKTIWFNKNHPSAIYCDRRDEQITTENDFCSYVEGVIHVAYDGT